MKANPVITFHLKESIPADLPATVRVLEDETERREIFSRLSSTTGADLEAQVMDCALVEVILVDDGKELV